MNESSFLAQLEQRTQQVKITLANLEAERVRIETQISRLQPLVPHYDALVAAERAIEEASIDLDTMAPDATHVQESGFVPEHMQSESSGQSSTSGAGESQSESSSSSTKDFGEGGSATVWGR